MDSAELYMMLIRPSMIPIIGEAWMIPFNLQIELSTWGWKIANPQEAKNASEKQSEYMTRKSSLESMLKASTGTDLQKKISELKAGVEADDFEKQLAKAEAANDKAKIKELKLQFKDRNTYLAKQLTAFETDLNTKLKGEKNEKDALAKKIAEATKKDQDELDKMQKENFTFRFSKRVDFASTQMLNSMKQGDLFPTGIITLFQRAPNLNHAASLIMTVSKFRLLDYKLRCEVSETMTDMREDWTAEFFSLSYVYKSRGMIKKESGAALVTAAVTQGTPRIFSMSMEGTLPI